MGKVCHWLCLLEMKALAERGALYVELALSETVAFSSVHRILFCGGVLNSWYLLIGGVCKILLLFLCIYPLLLLTQGVGTASPFQCSKVFTDHLLQALP